MFGLEELGLLGLFLGNILAATIVPFSSDALYIAVLAATRETAACFVVATIGNWLGSLVTYGMGRLGRWEWIEKWFKVKPETLEKLLINELMPQTEETEADKPPFYIPRILKKRKEDDKDGAN